jgi:hypothetical protein
MTKIIILCSTNQLTNARQKVFYNIAYGYTVVGKATDSSFQIHIVSTAEELDKVEFDKETNVYMYLAGGKIITADQTKQLVIVADKFTKLGEAGANANIEIIQ